MLRGIAEILKETITVFMQFVIPSTHYNKYLYSSSVKSNWRVMLVISNWRHVQIMKIMKKIDCVAKFPSGEKKSIW